MCHCARFNFTAAAGAWQARVATNQKKLKRLELRTTEQRQVSSTLPQAILAKRSAGYNSIYFPSFVRSLDIVYRMWRLDWWFYFSNFLRDMSNFVWLNLKFNSARTRFKKLDHLIPQNSSLVYSEAQKSVRSFGPVIKRFHYIEFRHFVITLKLFYWHTGGDKLRIRQLRILLNPSIILRAKNVSVGGAAETFDAFLINSRSLVDTTKFEYHLAARTMWWHVFYIQFENWINLRWC